VNGELKTTPTGTKIGAHLELEFKPITAQRFRLNIQDVSTPKINIEEFQLWSE
jgi:hypothetical protein